MHPAAYRFVKQTLASRAPIVGSVVEIGGLDINGTVRPLFTAAQDYVAIDVQDGPGVDFVADGSMYHPAEKVACVVACEVLEHASDAPRICENAFEMLATGGVFILTAAGEGRAAHSAVDGGPLRENEYYRNVSVEMLTQWLWQFAPGVVITTNSLDKDIYAVATKADA